MRIVFIHRTLLDYTVESPNSSPLGGTESGLCYLSVELAKLGHSVVLAANTSEPGHYLGVECLNYKTALTQDLFDKADAVVIANEAFGRKLRDLNVIKPLVLWTGHACDQHSMKPLESSRERKAWTGFAFVSQWQFEQYAKTFWIPCERSRVMRNAVAPIFASRQPADAWFEQGKSPILAYTSAPYRGLDVLLDAFPAIRTAIPDTSLRVFSNLSKDQGTANDKQYADLRSRCLAMQGVEYVGAVSQPALAGAMAEMAALAYPSTFAETSCIAAMEAMAMGAPVLTTALGALPETLAGFGRMVEFGENPSKMAREFALMAIDELAAIRRNPVQAALRRQRRIAFVRRNYIWAARALEWQSWLSEMIAGNKP